MSTAVTALSKTASGGQSSRWLNASAQRAWSWLWITSLAWVCLVFALSLTAGSQAGRSSGALGKTM